MGQPAISIPAAVILVLTLGLSSTAAGSELAVRTCIDDGVHLLTSRGVKCRDAERIALAAIQKSNCPVRTDHRGCYNPVRVRGWACRGLFPGEGHRFTCRRGPRWVHSSGGG